MKKIITHSFLTLFLFLSIHFQALSQISGNNNVCSGQTTTYSTIVVAASYNWSVTGAKNFTANGATVTVEWDGQGIGNVNLSTFDAGNTLIATSALSVTIGGKPSAIILSGFTTSCFDDGTDLKDSCFTACERQPTTYTAPFNAGSTYTWEIIGSGTMTNLAPNQIEVIWSNTGMQAIKVTVMNASGCFNSFEKCVRVIQAPKAVIGTAPLFSRTITVCQDAPFYLQDSSIGSIGRRWDFGDGNYSVRANPTHSYAQAGTYQVILTANNSCYCLNTDTITVNVLNTAAPEIVCPSVVCHGDTVSYSSPSACSGFSWSAVNGTILGDSSSNTVDVVWNNHVGFLQLLGTNCNNSCDAPAIEKIAVIIDSIPIQGESPACKGDQKIYSIEPIPGSSYQWSIDQSLGEITEDNGTSIVVDFNGNGASGYIRLNYHNPVLNCSGSTELFVETKERLEFAFPSEICADDISSFAVGLPINWQVIDTAGTVFFAATNTAQATIDWSVIPINNYTLVLDGSNSYCNTIELPVRLVAPPLAPSVILGASSFCAGAGYSYSVAPASGYQVEWEVIGGTPETFIGNNITVQWDTAAPFEIKAAYRQLESPFCLSEQEVRTISSPLNNADSILAVDSICGGDSTLFSLNFVPDWVEWTVEVNNGSIDGVSILTDRYLSQITVQASAAKTQTATLKASGSICGNNFSLLKDIFIQTFPTPTINFSNPNPCPNEAVRLSSNTNDVIWEVNGILFNEPTPTIRFPDAQAATVKVTANYVGPNGCMVERVNLKPLKSKTAPKAVISVVLDTNSSYCKDILSPISLEASFQASNSSGYNYSWEKDGIPLGVTGRSYLTPPLNAHGSYTVVVTDRNSGCSSISSPFKVSRCDTLEIDSLCTNILTDTSISIEVVIDSLSCNEFYVSQVNLTGAGVNLISIRPLNPELEIFSHGAYGLGFRAPAGTHTLLFDGWVENGTDTFCFNTSVNKTVTLEPDFDLIRQACEGVNKDRFQFINTSSYTGAVPSYTWNFGNGTVISTTPEYLVDFSAGMDTVTLTANGCSIKKGLNAEVAAVASFTSTAPACQREVVQFTNTSSGATIEEYHWEMGLKELYDENPRVTFEDFSTSQNFRPDIDLFILDQFGCRDSVSDRIRIHGNKFSSGININGSTIFCEGDSLEIKFINTTNVNTPLSYSWSNQESTSSIQAKQTGNYQVSITDNVGCRFVSAKVNVQAQSAPNPTIIGKDVFCAYEDVHLTTQQHNSFSYEWQIVGDSSTINAPEFKRRLSSGNYLIQLNAIATQSGCTNLNPPFPVTVRSNVPQPTITATGASPLCEGSPITLTASSTGGALYWNTGQTGNSITQSLAGEYIVTQTDPSGCRESASINIEALPDFSNFMKGCYCLPSMNPPILYGIPNMDKYQWKKNGIPVPAPNGQQANIQASSGDFELIATTLAGCVDSAGIMSVTVGGCEPCVLDISDFEINCSGANADSTFYDFSLIANLDQPLDTYDLASNILVGNQPVTLLQMQPNRIAGSGNTITGMFVTVGSSVGDSVCIQVTASNPAVNCTAELCTTIKPFACDFSPNFTHSFNPYTCELTLNQSTAFTSCNVGDSVLYGWSIVQGGVRLARGQGETFSFEGLSQGVAAITLTVYVINKIDGSSCWKTYRSFVTVPDCSCQNDCSALRFQSANFVRFVQDSSGCATEFEVTFRNPSNVPVSSNFLKVSKGTVVSITPSSGSGTSTFLVRYIPENSNECVNQCFEFFLNSGGQDCCINFCVDIPSCTCGIKVSKLGIDCSRLGASNGGWYDFSVDVDLNACNGFTYDAVVNATLAGQPAQVVAQQLTTLNNGYQRILGTVDLTGLNSGNPLCIEVVSSLGGITCSDQVCLNLPPVACKVVPSFTTEFDPNACIMTVISTTTTGNCMVLDTAGQSWTVTVDGKTYREQGAIAQFYNLSGKDVKICLSASAVDFSGNIACTEEICQEMILPDCECTEPCDNVIISSTDFIQTIDANDSCIMRFNVTVEDLNGNPFQLNTLLAREGVVLNTTLLSSSNGSNTYQVDFYPNQPWNGGQACFDVFVILDDGSACCIDFCIELPKCDCDFAVNPFTISCTAPNGQMGDFNFTIPVGFFGSVGFNYATTLVATLNGVAVPINSYQPMTIVHGFQNITGTISLPQGQPGDVLCFFITASLGGKECTAQSCATLPMDDCDVFPNFTWSIDPVTCEVTFNSTTTFGSCTYPNPAGALWTITQFGNVYGGVGNSFKTSNLMSGLTNVCIQVQGFNWTGNADCHPEVCVDIVIPPCPDSDIEEEEEENESFGRRKRVEKTISELTTYPNPTKDILFIEWPESLDESVSFQLIDQHSKVVLNDTKVVKGKIAELALNSYSEGVYILHIEWGEQVSKQKVIIMK